FWVEGKFTKDEIKEYFPDLLEEYAEKQRQWFHNLVTMANNDWQKNRHMLAVSDLQRKAAKWLGVQAEWVEIRMQETNQCPFCTAQIPPTAVK
ncbi:hypothetical protein, partial [Duganella sp. Dugasp56]|uniref:hypothetical protein n=1 Tax=Duganella sp. Dugasp56 TaxID=3243046 RepID=UPI0039AEF494